MAPKSIPKNHALPFNHHGSTTLSVSNSHAISCPELKKTLTQEEKDLSAAGYEHLDANGKQRKLEETNLDIQDHEDPGHSSGLTAAEAKSRLEQDGPNILTPPKKKSTLRKVRFQITY
jgi:magnesium-transporting ATPase (P-type)